MVRGGIHEVVCSVASTAVGQTNVQDGHAAWTGRPQHGPNWTDRGGGRRGVNIDASNRFRFDEMRLPSDAVRRNSQLQGSP